MQRRWTWPATALLLAVSILTVSCDDAFRDDSPLAPEVVPQERSLFRWDRWIIDPEPTDTVDPIDPGDTTSTSFVKEQVPVGTVTYDTKLIDLMGGSFGTAGHTVIVPMGAVTSLTRFSMERKVGDAIVVELHATTVAGLFGKNDVTSFRVPVRLELSYDRATSNVDPAKLVIVRILENGKLEVLPTKVDPDRRVIWAELDHFSLYAMASN